MISPQAIRLLLQHFDSLDRSLSRRLVRKRPWDEEALTSLLCDLLDEDCQQDENVQYPIISLLEDLSATDEPISFSASINTHSYPKSVERYVTQSDIGLIVEYQDQFESKCG